VTLLVSGWVALDDLETPFASAKGVLGGPATYAALAASLFTDVRLLAGVGEDFPAPFRERLTRPNIDTAGVTTHAEPTSRWGGRYGYDMNSRDTVFTEVGVNGTWRPVLPAGWEDSNTVFLTASNPVVQREIIGSLRAPKASLVDTILFYIESELADVRRTMGVATFATVNESEARRLTGQASIARAARQLLADGAQRVIVKLGEYGAAYIGAGDYFIVPGFPLDEIVDPTGAGDTFGGAFMGYLDSVPELTESEVRRAMVYGSAVASFCVEGIGTSRLESLSRNEVESRYRSFRRLTHFEVPD
jgi:sugar/nucleoside kinase (ribokinase family)